MPKNTNYELLDDCYKSINQSACTIISAVIRKERIHQNKLRWDIVGWANRLLFERIDRFLEKQNPQEYGLAFIDKVNKKFDSNVRRTILDYCYHGTRYRDIQFILEDPIPVESHHRNMSQLADLSAWSIGRKHKLGTTVNITDEKNEGYYSLIEQKFDTDLRGNAENCGIKFFP